MKASTLTLKTTSNVTLIYVVLSLIFAAVVHAEDLGKEKTQLDMNKAVFKEVSEPAEKELKMIDYIGNAVLLKPVEVVKKNTQEKVLLNKMKFEHTALDMSGNGKNPFKRNRSEGPKLSLHF